MNKLFAIQPTLRKVTETPKVEEPKLRADAPKWRNQDVKRSSQENDGYRYSDWRNW